MVKVVEHLCFFLQRLHCLTDIGAQEFKLVDAFVFGLFTLFDGFYNCAYRVSDISIEEIEGEKKHYKNIMAADAYARFTLCISPE